jgi:hypothetical protein
MARRESSPTKSDLQDALLNIYDAAFTGDGSVAKLRELVDTCIAEVESVIPDAADQIDLDADEASDELETDDDDE